MLFPLRALTVAALAAALVAGTGAESAVALPGYWKSHVHSRPSGPGIVKYGALHGHGLTKRLATARGEAVSFARHRYRFSDFSVPLGGPYRAGVAVGTPTALLGSGVGRTVFSMRSRTSTHARSIPTGKLQSNPLALLRVSGATTRLSGFTLQGTNQGHPYNGLVVDRIAKPRVSDVQVRDVPGTSSAPPGETFGLDDQHTSGAVYTRVEVDGDGIGAALFGSNGSRNVTVCDSRFHDSGHSFGVAFWHVRNIRLTDVISTGNHRAGLSFERVSGTVTITRPVLTGNGEADMRIASDQGSATYRIVDPVFTGKYFTVMLPPTYYSHPERQKRSQVHLIIHGKDVTTQRLRFLLPSWA